MLRLLLLDDADEYDVEELAGDEVGPGDERREDVQHEALHLTGLLVVDNLEHGLSLNNNTAALVNIDRCKPPVPQVVVELVVHLVKDEELIVVEGAALVCLVVLVGLVRFLLSAGGTPAWPRCRSFSW